MTRRDFILISETLHESKPIASAESERGREWRKICLAMATALATTCPRFDRARFLKACGMES